MDLTQYIAAAVLSGLVSSIIGGMFGGKIAIAVHGNEIEWLKRGQDRLSRAIDRINERLAARTGG